MPLYLVWFVLHPDYHEFRLQELESLAGCFGVDRSELWTCNLPEYVSWQDGRCEKPLGNDHSNSFAWVCLPGDQVALSILERSILVRGFMQVWSSGVDHERAKQVLREDEHVRREFLDRYIHDEVDFSWKVRSVGKKLSRTEQVSRMNDYGFLFRGTERVNLKNPSLTLGIFEDWRCLGEPEATGKSISKEEISRVQSSLKRVYIGRIIGVQSSAEAGDNKSLWWLRYTLNRRPILGPTTMDNELAFIMCNIARVKRGDFVFDPFCGTGGILISASHFGATCFGSDLDLRVINGWFCSYVNPHMIRDKTIREDHPKSIYSNFDYYGLERPGILRMDISQSSLRSSWIDAIVCDPPYGIRATSRTTNSSPSNPLLHEHKSPSLHLGNNFNYRQVTQDTNAGTYINVDTEVKLDHNCSSLGKNSFGVLQPVDDMIYELLSFASKTLVEDGHLVFLLPLLASGSSRVISNLIESWKHQFSIDFPYMQTLGGGLGRLLVHMRLLRDGERKEKLATSR